MQGACLHAVVVDGVVHGTTIVPHDHITRAPHVTVAFVIVGGVRVEKIKQGPTLCLGHAFEVGNGITWVSNRPSHGV